MNYLAIDPGASGGIAWRIGGTIEAMPMPDGISELADTIADLSLRMEAATTEHIAIVEKVGCYMPGNSGPAACTFARHCGHIEMALYCFGIGTVAVTPGKWMKALGTWPKDKKERKHAIRDNMATRYPMLKVTLKTADALGILTYAMQGGR